MDEPIDFIAFGLLGAALLIGVAIYLRWRWIQQEKRKIVEQSLPHAWTDDEYDQTHHGRVIKTIRCRVIEGRVEFRWEFSREYIHRGFELIGWMRKDGENAWNEFVRAENTHDWHESMNHGDNRTYAFKVRKVYRFFFGLVAGDEQEVVYDNFSLSVRKGRYLKEKLEVMKDQNALIEETHKFTQGLNRLRKESGLSQKQEPKKISPVEDLKARREQDDEFQSYYREEAEKIKKSNLSKTEKKKAMDKLERDIESARVRG